MRQVAKATAARFDSGNLFELSGELHSEQAHSRVEIDGPLALYAANRALDQFVSQESIYLKEGIAADLESVVVNWSRHAQPCQRRQRLARYAVQNIHLHFCLIGEQLHGSARLMTIRLGNGLIELR